MKFADYCLFLLYKEPQFQYGIVYLRAIDRLDANEQAIKITKNMKLISFYIQEYTEDMFK